MLDSSGNCGSSGELQCVGRLEIDKPKPVGFLCGTLPVPTDKAFHHNAFNSAIVPSSQTITAPRYRMLPTETDLNTPPFLPNSREKVLPISAANSRTASGDIHWESSGTSQNLARKCETLAVFGLAEYGDEIDVVAPADIMKQIFKMPYSKARLSIAVHRIGQTLVLNTGPDIEEGEKLVRRHNSKSKGVDQSLFLNFAMHSVRAEACDCPPAHAASGEHSSSDIFPGDYVSSKGSFVPSDQEAQGGNTSFLDLSEKEIQNKGQNCHSENPNINEDKIWDSKHQKKDKRHDAVKKTSEVGEKSKRSVQESEKHRRGANDSFQRVLFWQFHNFRMLLGSDLLLFSNEKYVAVSLHLWDVARQVTPLTWLEAWLDNIMASVPELAICYHRNGVVQGYELLKTDDIFLLKGISEDGIPAFHPHVVQQNGLSVLRFLQNNCKQDPGVYWLYKNAGDHVIQLFDLSVMPKSHSSEDHDNCSSSLPSVMHKGRRDSLFSLGLLLYRVAHRLSLSMASNSKAKCARLFKKCLDFLDEQDHHLVVRAFAHEQFARLILKCYEELDLTSESVPLVSEVTVHDAKDEGSGSMIVSGSVLEDEPSFQVTEDSSSARDAKIFELSMLKDEASSYASGNSLAAGGVEEGYLLGDTVSPNSDDFHTMLQMSATPHVIHTVADPISSKLAAVHHVSQAIKSLRWKRQLQNSETEVIEHRNKIHDKPSAAYLSICACGDADCIEVCDIREWLPKSRMDHKLWKLVLLLGESYLALGQAYTEAGQLPQALTTVDLACSIYGSMPQHLEDDALISSMKMSFPNDPRKSDLSSSADCFGVDQFSFTYLFWAKAWTLVGDIYIQFLMKSKEETIQPESAVQATELRMQSDVEKEVKRLKKKLGQFKQNCSTCSLINCSCQSDRASSGNSASSSNGDVFPLTYGRKQSKRSSIKHALHFPSGDTDGGSLSQKDDSQVQASMTDKGYARDSLTDAIISRSDETSENDGVESIAAAASEPSGIKTPKRENGGIFKFLNGPTVGDAQCSLSAAISCYTAAQKALSGLPSGLADLQSVLKKKGWACNELGRMWIDRKDLDKAELAFADAINAFKKVSDHTNIILINCNLGHGRRALAEEMLSKMENLRAHPFFQNAHQTALETAKIEYSESLRYYGAARSELQAIEEGESSVVLSSGLRNEVFTQFAHTYLRLGMLLAREDVSAMVYDNGALESLAAGHVNPSERRLRGELRTHEISANDAIREAISMYELLGELRKQEVAYAYFQLACYHRDCCLKFLHQIKPSRSEGVLQKVKRYASLAERNWQKSIDFYGPRTHATMYLTILIEEAALLLNLSDAFHSIMMMESALSCLLEGRQVFEEPAEVSPSKDHTEINAKFWSQLQALLKKMLQIALSGGTSKSSLALQQATSMTSKAGGIAKLKKLYGMSLKSTDMSQLHAMYQLWIA